MMMADIRHEHVISPITPEHNDFEDLVSPAASFVSNGVEMRQKSSAELASDALANRLDNWRRDFVRRTAQTCRHNELISAARRLSAAATPVSKASGGAEDAASTAAADEQHITRILAREFQSFVLIMSKACRVLYADDNVVQELLGTVASDSDNGTSNTSAQNVIPVKTLVGANLLHYVHAEDQAKSRIQLRQTLDQTIQNSNGYGPNDFNGSKSATNSMQNNNNNKPFKLPSAIEPLCAFAVRLRSAVGAPVAATGNTTLTSSGSPTKIFFTGEAKVKSEPQKFASSTSSSPAQHHTSPAMWMQYHLCLLKGNWIKTNASILNSGGNESGGQVESPPPPPQDSNNSKSTWSKRLLEFLRTSDASYKELDYIWFGIVKVVKPNATIMSPNCFTMTLGLMPLPPGADPCGSGKNATSTAENGGAPSETSGSNASTPNSNNGTTAHGSAAAAKKESKKRLRSGGELSKRNLSGENEFYGKLSILDVDQRCTCLTGFFASEMCDTQFFYYINPYYIPLVVNNITKMILRESDICTCTVKMRNAHETNFSVDLLLTVTAQPNFTNHQRDGFGFGSAPTPILFLNCVVSPSLVDLNIKTLGLLDSHTFQLEEIKKSCDNSVYQAAYDTWNCWTNPIKLKTETKLAVLSGCLYKLYESVLASDNNGLTDAEAEPDPKRPRISAAAGSFSRFYCTADEHAFVPMPLNSTRNDLASPTMKSTDGKPGERRASLHVAAAAGGAAGHALRTGSLTDVDNSMANNILVQQLVNGSGVFDEAVTRARCLEAATNGNLQYQQQNYAAMLFNGNFMPSQQPLPNSLPPNAVLLRPAKPSSNVSPSLPILQQPEMKDRQLKELLSQPIDSEKRFRCNILAPASSSTAATTSISASTTFTASNKKLLNGGAVTVPPPPPPQNNNMAMMWGGNALNVSSGGGGGLQHSQQQAVPYGSTVTTVVMSGADGNLYSTPGGNNVMLAPRGGGQMVVMGPVISGGQQPYQQHGGGGGGMFMTSGGGPGQPMIQAGQVSPNFSPSPVGVGIRNVRIMSPNNTGQQQQHVLVRGGMPPNMRPINAAGTPVSMVTVGQQQQQQAMMNSDMRGQPPMYFAPPGGPQFQPPYAASPALSPNSANSKQHQQQQNAPVRQLQQQLREKHQNLEQNLRIQDDDLARMKQDVIAASPYGSNAGPSGSLSATSGSGGGGGLAPANASEFSSAVTTPVSAATPGGSGSAASPQQQQVVEKINRLQQRSSMQKQELGVLNVKLATASASTAATSAGPQSAAGPPAMMSPPNATMNASVAVSSSSSGSGNMMPKLQSSNANMHAANMMPFSQQQQQHNDQTAMMMQTRGPTPQISYSSMPMQQQRFVGPPPPVIGGNSGGMLQHDMSISPAQQHGAARRLPMMPQQRQQQQPMMMNYSTGPDNGAAMQHQQQHGGGNVMLQSGGNYAGGPHHQQQQQPSNVFYSPQLPNNNSGGGLMLDSNGPGSASELDNTNDAFFDDLISTLEANTAAGDNNASGGSGQSSNSNRMPANFLNEYLS